MNRALLATAVLVLAAPTAANAEWSAPTEVPNSAGMWGAPAGDADGSLVLSAGLSRVVVVPRTAAGFGTSREIGPNDRFEQALGTKLAANGDATVITQRRRPGQKLRVRVTLTTAGGSRLGPMTVSDKTRSATQPELAVSADGTSVAAWWWHSARNGWLPQAATRLSGQARFSAPQTLSTVGLKTLSAYGLFPTIRVAAGDGGRVAVAWGVGSWSGKPASDLRLRSTTDGRIGEATTIKIGVTDLRVASLAVSDQGQVLIAYLEGGLKVSSVTSLKAASAPAGQPLPAPTQIATGDASGSYWLDSSFSGDGMADVAWAPRSMANAYGGPILVVTRTADGTYGPVQAMAPDSANADWVDLQAGPGGKTALSWHSRQFDAGVEHDLQQMSIRSSGSTTFGAPTTLLPTAPFGLSMVASIAFTASGDIVAAWATDAAPGELGSVRFSTLPEAEVN